MTKTRSQLKDDEVLGLKADENIKRVEGSDEFVQGCNNSQNVEGSHNVRNLQPTRVLESGNNLDPPVLKDFMSAMHCNVNSTLHDWLQANSQQITTIMRPVTDLMQKIGDQITKSIDNQMEYTIENFGPSSSLKSHVQEAVAQPKEMQ